MSSVYLFYAVLCPPPLACLGPFRFILAVVLQINSFIAILLTFNPSVLFCFSRRTLITRIEMNVLIRYQCTSGVISCEASFLSQGKRLDPECLVAIVEAQNASWISKSF